MDKEFYLSKLRDKNTPTLDFRQASNELSKLTALESLNFVETESIEVVTPHKKTVGVTIKNPPLLVIILRSGMALLPSFLEIYPEASVAVIGIYRESITAKPHLYYQNIPKIDRKAPVFILDPMLATGQSAKVVIELFKNLNIEENMIHIFSFFGAKPGVESILNIHSQVKLHIHQIDPELNKKFEIVPGLGDFGDRYFKS